METSPCVSASTLSNRGSRLGDVSGSAVVFLRTPATSTYGSGWPDDSLEVQLANRQGGAVPPSRAMLAGGGAVLRHGNAGGPTSFDTQAALLSYGQTGEWQQMEIQAIGDAIHVTLNGRFLGVASAGGNDEGYIGLQAETGAIEFRSIEINEGSSGPVDQAEGRFRADLRWSDTERLEAGEPGFWGL